MTQYLDLLLLFHEHEIYIHTLFVTSLLLLYPLYHSHTRTDTVHDIINLNLYYKENKDGNVEAVTIKTNARVYEEEEDVLFECMEENMKEVQKNTVSEISFTPIPDLLVGVQRNRADLPVTTGRLLYV